MIKPTILYTGSLALLPQSTLFRVGSLQVLYEAGGLRYLRIGETEVLRGIYAAVRDQNWGTVPGMLVNERVNQQPDSFQVTYESHHQQGEIEFRWQGSIHAREDGTLDFEMVGKAYSTFKRNRIGFCVLHPMTCAGQRCHIEHTDGTITSGVFPEYIAPHQPFRAIRAIQHEYAPGQWLEVRMEGDTFEMEDQRNWLDASYKTYCTPLERPFPVLVEAGTEVRQAVRVKLLNPAAASPQSPVYVSSAAAPVILTIEPESGVRLPPLGLGLAAQVEAPSEAVASRLAALKLAHLRLDLRFRRADWQQTLEHAAKTARMTQTALEVAVHLTESAADDLQQLAEAVKASSVPVARWLIFREGEKSTAVSWVALARGVLGSGVPIVSGTDAFFTELNRQRPEYEQMDGVVYSVNPQVHAFDDASLVETLPVHAVTLASARQFCGDKPIHLSPITFKMRWNPNATVQDESPPQADPRQRSLFGAGWTLGSIKYSALGGAASLTYYETTGYSGVMASGTAAPIQDEFPIHPGDVYPMYHVFADVGEFAGGTLHHIATSDTMRVDGLLLRQGHRQRLMLANLTSSIQQVVVKGLDGVYRARTLDETTALAAMREPTAYRAYFDSIRTDGDGTLHLELRPYAVLTLDSEGVEI